MKIFMTKVDKMKIAMEKHGRNDNEKLRQELEILGWKDVRKNPDSFFKTKKRARNRLFISPIRDYVPSFTFETMLDVISSHIRFSGKKSITSGELKSQMINKLNLTKSDLEICHSNGRKVFEGRFFACLNTLKKKNYIDGNCNGYSLINLENEMNELYPVNESENKEEISNGGKFSNFFQLQSEVEKVINKLKSELGDKESATEFIIQCMNRI